jgi:ABC transporter transmembrane region
MANLLVGDAINNYRTVASFAQEELLVKDFKKLLDEPSKALTRKAHLMGLGYGFS